MGTSICKGSHALSEAEGAVLGVSFSAELSRRDPDRSSLKCYGVFASYFSHNLLVLGKIMDKADAVSGLCRGTLWAQGTVGSIYFNLMGSWIT